MKQVQNEIGRKNGELLVEQLKSGKFKKDFRPNHGTDFTGGLEGLHRYRFATYLGSCSCFLMDCRIRQSRSEYNG